MLERFYKENYHIVYGYLLSLCADPVLAEELAAETFAKAIANIHRYDPKYKPSTWLCTIGRNLFYNHRHRQVRNVPLEDALGLSIPSAEDVYLKKELLTQLLQIINTLPEEHRRIFLMRMQGMAFRDIGLALGRTENWARVTYYRIKNKIRTEMEGTQ